MRLTDNQFVFGSLGSNSPSLEAVGIPIGGHNQGVVSAPRQWVDSEDETGEPPEADWSSHVSADILHTLSDAEKRRQEIINGEFYYIEPYFFSIKFHFYLICFVI